MYYTRWRMGILAKWQVGYFVKAQMVFLRGWFFVPIQHSLKCKFLLGMFEHHSQSNCKNSSNSVGCALQLH